MQRLKQSDLPAFREKLWRSQGMKCALSGMPITLEQAVTDHCHKTGEVRGVLHRGVNSMLGKIENHRKLAGLSNDVDLARMLAGVVHYLCRKHDYAGVRYPTHKTAEEKRISTNAKARKRRAATKKAV